MYKALSRMLDTKCYSHDYTITIIFSKSQLTQPCNKMLLDNYYNIISSYFNSNSNILHLKSCANAKSASTFKISI